MLSEVILIRMAFMGFVLYLFNTKCFLKSCYLLSTIADPADAIVKKRKQEKTFLPSNRLHKNKTKKQTNC